MDLFIPKNGAEVVSFLEETLKQLRQRPPSERTDLEISQTERLLDEVNANPRRALEILINAYSADPQEIDFRESGKRQEWIGFQPPQDVK